MNQNRLRSELLAPAGSLNKLKTAISYGADAVYIGTPDLSLRTKSQITLEDLTEGIKYAHKYGKKVYLTLNLFSNSSSFLDKVTENSLLPHDKLIEQSLHYF